MKPLLTVLLIIPFFASSQTKQDSLWLPFKSFLGSWEGTSEGQPGKGKYERSYQHILNKKFIEVRNKSIYPPTGKHPKGEVHEDVGYISYDKARKTFVLRQFHIEGFVNQYKIESISATHIVFVSEAIENIPAGWRAKETYQFTGDREFIESFELAEPGKDFELYSRAILTKTN